MNYSDTILDFINGTIDPQSESELFYAFASNDELRSEFKQILNIKSAIRDNLSSFAPSAQSTFKIFSSVGLPVIIGSSAIPVINVGFFSKLKSSIINHKTGITNSIVSSVITAIIVIFLTPSFMTKFEPNSNFSLSTTNLPEINNKAENVESGLSSIPKKIIVKYIYLNKLNDQTEEPVISNLPIHNPITLNKTDNVPEKISKSLAYKDFYIHSEPKIFLEQEKLFENESNKLGLSLEICSKNDWMSPLATISPSQYQKFNNLSIGLAYNFLDALDAGVSLKRENFFLRFRGFDDNGLNSTIEMQPNFTTYEIFAKYKPFIIANFEPFLSVSLGLNNIGLVHREILGLSWSAYDNIDFILSFGLSSLIYKRDNISYNSFKYELNYGLNIHL